MYGHVRATKSVTLLTMRDHVRPRISAANSALTLRSRAQRGVSTCPPKPAGRRRKGEGGQCGAACGRGPWFETRRCATLLTMRSQVRRRDKTSRAATREQPQSFEIAANERLLLGARPALDLALGRDGVGDLLEPLRIGERHRTARRSVAVKMTAVVLGKPELERRARRPGVVAAVGALHDVKPCTVGHRPPPSFETRPCGPFLRMRAGWAPSKCRPSES